MRTLFIVFMFLFLPSRAVFGAAENAEVVPDSLPSAGAELSCSVPVRKYRYAREAGRSRVIYRGELRTSASLIDFRPTEGLDIVNGISTGRWDVGLGFGLGVVANGCITGTLYITVKADVYEGVLSTLFVGGDVGGCVIIPAIGGEYLRSFSARRSMPGAICRCVALYGPFIGLDVTL